MSSKTYVNLHTHSAHSAKDGLSKLDELCKAVAADGQPAVAVTDHGNVGAAWKLAAAAKESGIKPVMGMEAYLAIGSRFEENSRRIPRDAMDADGSDFGSGAAGFKDQDYEHLTLLASNRAGWRNLALMSTESSDSFWKKPRLDYEQLAERSEGIIALTGCISGPVAGALLRDGLPDEKGRIFNGQQAARDALSKLIDVFGRDQVNVEIMEHGIPVEQKITTQLLELAKEFKLPAVATNDSHYTESQDRLAHDMWLCIGQSSTKRTYRISDTDRWSFTGSGYHLRSYAEMVEALSPYGKAGLAALHRTTEIADGIEADVLPASKLRLPAFPAPDGFVSSDAYFKHLVFEGANRRYGDGWQQRHPEVRARLNHEVKVIRRMGFIDYFLIVHDIVTWARLNGVRVGPGRGSAAGSCVSYCLGIVAIEPISTGLLFERFLDDTREEMPDIDLDFDTAGQPRVFAYIAQRWGSDVVARLGTFGFARARKAIKDSARAIFPPEVSGKLGTSMAKLVPGIQTKISQILDPTFTAGAPLRDLIAADEDARTVIDAAATIEGVIFNESVHACGVVIATEPLTEIGIPLRRDRRKGRGGAWVTQWDGKDITKLGLTKLDILGLRNLDTVNHAIHQIEKTTGELIDPEVLPTDSSDPRVRKVWSLLADGNTTGVFQLLSSGMTKLCQQVRPESLEDISALVALFRPGPLGAGFHEIFARRKNGEEAVDYGIFTSDPAEQQIIESVLGTTYGVVVYQEQAMQIGGVVAGFGASENNRLRRAISKKNGAEMVAVGELFIDGAATEILDEDGNLVKQAFAESTAARLWDSMKSAGEYMFNKAHSYAYGYLAYVTAYMKANWPEQFAAATLASDNDDDRRAASLTQMRKDGITILGPSVNSSELVTTCGKDLIVRLGLGEIKGLGSEAAAAIIADRDLRGTFTAVDTYGMKHSALGTLIARVQVPSSEEGGDPRALTNAEVQALIESGAVDEMCGGKRKGQLAVAHCLRVHPDVEPFDSEFPVIERAALERYRLGVLLSQNPLLALADQVGAWKDSTGSRPVSLNELPDDDNAQVLTLGVITALNAGTYGGGQKLGVIVENPVMSMPGIAFDSTVQRLTRERKMPKLGDIVAVRGRVRIVDVPVSTGDGDDEEQIDGVDAAEVVEEKVRRKELMVHDLTTLPLTDEGELPTVARGAKIIDLFNRGAEIRIDEQPDTDTDTDAGAEPASPSAAAPSPSPAPAATATQSAPGSVSPEPEEPRPGSAVAQGTGSKGARGEDSGTERIVAENAGTENAGTENIHAGRPQPLFVVVLPAGEKLDTAVRKQKVTLRRIPTFRRLLTECVGQVQALPAGSVVRVEGDHGFGELVVLVAPADAAATTRTAQVDVRPESLSQLLSAAGVSAVEVTGKARLVELTMTSGKKATLIPRAARAAVEQPVEEQSEVA